MIMMRIMMIMMMMMDHFYVNSPPSLSNEGRSRLAQCTVTGSRRQRCSAEKSRKRCSAEKSRKKPSEHSFSNIRKRDHWGSALRGTSTSAFAPSLHLDPRWILIHVASWSVFHLNMCCILILVASWTMLHLDPCYILFLISSSGLVLLGLSWSVLVCPELSWTILKCCELFWLFKSF